MYLFRLVSMLGGWLSPFPFWQKKLGQQGESLAIRHYRRKGYFLVARNVHLGHSELDVVMSNGEEVLILEVKTRTCSDKMQRLIDLVNRDQQVRILKAGHQFLKQKGWIEAPHRFVLVYVEVLPTTSKFQILCANLEG